MVAFRLQPFMLWSIVEPKPPPLSLPVKYSGFSFISDGSFADASAQPNYRTCCHISFSKKNVRKPVLRFHTFINVFMGSILSFFKYKNFKKSRKYYTLDF